MLHLRVVSPVDLTDAVRDVLEHRDGVAHLIVHRGAAVHPPGDLVEADVARECADELLGSLGELGVDHRGGITLEQLDTVLSDAADAAEEAAPGEGADALVWDQLVARTGEESRLSGSFLAFLTIACLLAAIGAVTDSPVTVVGAMVLGPEFGPLAAVAVGTVLRRRDLVSRGALAVGVGFPAAMVVTALATLAFNGLGLLDSGALDALDQVDFIYEVGWFSLIVALLAGAAGMLSLTSAKSSALVGVFISVTTVPAAAFASVAAVEGRWAEAVSSLLQLLVNVVGIVVAAAATLLLVRRRGRLGEPTGGSRRARVGGMTDLPGALDAALTGAERLLTRRAGASVHLSEPEDLGGSGESVVMRTRMGHNPFSDRRSVVVKHYLGARPCVDPFRYEVASCQLFTALPADSRPSPMIIAHDPDQRLLVLEDLGRSSTLADKLFGPDPDTAARCLLSWARALGRMQACTAGREDDFGALLRRLGERVRRDPIAEQARAALAGTPELVHDVLGVTMPPDAEAEARATARLLGGTRFRAFSTAETCPDNNLVTSLGVRFVDFEWGCFRDVALDAAYFRVPFPACPTSFALPDGMDRQMLAAWLAEVAGVWPELGETDVLEPRLVDADLLWVWWCTWTLLPRLARRDGPIGRDTGRSPRISTALRHYWQGLGMRCARTRPATAELAGLVTGAIDARFPDTPRTLPVFPAFRGLA